MLCPIKKKYFVLFFLVFTGCENVLYNDLGLQGEWEAECEVDYKTQVMIIKFDNDTFYYKKKGLDDWEAQIPCAASFGTIFLKESGKTSKGGYIAFFTYLTINSFSYETGFLWMNGYWVKQ